MAFDRYPAIDEDGQFPDEVRLRWAQNLSASGSPENDAMLSVVVPSVVQTIADQDIPAQVAAAVAAAPTVVDAAAAAVDAEVASRNLAEMVTGYPPEAAGGFVGANGRGTDLLVDESGAVIESVFGLWVERMRAAGLIGFETATIYAGFAGENRRATELIVETLTGDVPQWVLERWKSRMNIVVPTPVETAAIVLPSTLYMVVGQTYRFDWAKIIRDWDPSFGVTVTGPSSGSGNFGDYWQYTPAAETSFTLTITVKNRKGETVVSTTRPVVAVNAPSGAALRHLGIGDSITRDGSYIRASAMTILGGQTRGIRTYDNGVLNVEGRGGWSLDGYFTRIGHPTYGDSPFIFPVGVDAEKFWGNTNFWKNVTVTDPSGYDFAGFQRIARGWASSGGYLFDSNGYPVSPASGDVVVDPNQAAGSIWRQYNGSAWVAMSPQPATEFSFSKYMDRYASAFAGGAPTSISIMLATNDFFSTMTETSWNTYKSRIDSFITSIRAWSNSVPIILIGAPSPGPATLWSTTSVARFDFNRRMIEYAYRMAEAYDTPAARSNRVYLTSFLGTVADANMADYVHPASAGHTQMGVWLAGLLAYLITQGVIA